MMQQHTLKRIQIKGYKSIHTLDLTLNPINIVIGSNGVGKSNFISAFKFLNALVNKNLQNYVYLSGGADKLLHFGSKRTEELSFVLRFEANTYKVSLAPVVGDRLAITNEITAFHADAIGYQGGSKKEVLTNTYTPESQLPSLGTKTIPQHVARCLNSYKIYHFHDTSNEAKVKKTQPLSDSLYLQEDARNLAIILYTLKTNAEFVQSYTKIVEAIQLVAPYFQDFILIPDETHRILPRWKHKDQESPFLFDDLSDGTLRFMCLATLLLQPLPLLPDTILIDEPELGLHPHAIRVLASLIKSVAAQGKQVIASSQSVTLINEFNPEDILVSDLKKNETHIRRLTHEEIASWLEDYQLGTLWEKNIIGGTPHDFL